MTQSRAVPSTCRARSSLLRSASWVKFPTRQRLRRSFTKKWLSHNKKLQRKRAFSQRKSQKGANNHRRKSRKSELDNWMTLSFNSPAKDTHHRSRQFLGFPDDRRSSSTAVGRAFSSDFYSFLYYALISASFWWVLVFCSVVWWDEIGSAGFFEMMEIEEFYEGRVAFLLRYSSSNWR